MKVFIRVDASIEIGTGHVMRCLTLAEDLRTKGANVSFICRKLQGNLISYIEGKDFQVYSLPPPKENNYKADRKVKHSHFLGVSWETDAIQTKLILQTEKQIDWLIVDHYGIDKKWELEIRPNVKKLMIIDDLADRTHDCDLLLDQNLYKNMENRYNGLIPLHCLKFFGPKYALLRQEFKKARNHIKERDGNVKRIFIFFGGSDPTNETMKVLEAIKLLNRADILFDVVVGATNQNKDQIKQCCSKMSNVAYHCQIDYMAELMKEADLAIGAGGSTTWERCYLGLPTITIITAENQIDVISEASRANIVWHIGKSKDVQATDILTELECLLNNPDIIQKMTHSSMLIMGEDLEQDILLEFIIWGRKKVDTINNFYLKDLEERDLGLILNWRNSKAIRANMHTDHEITMSEHDEWFKRVRKNDHTLVKLLFYGNKPLGFVNFSDIDKKNSICCWGFYIGEGEAPKGSGTILGLLALDLVFETIGIRKLCAEVLAFNDASLKFHKKLGFKEEGRFVEHINKDGKYIDVIALALFREEWSEVKNSLIVKTGRKP